MNTIQRGFFFVPVAIAALVIMGCGNGEEMRYEEERSAYEDRINEMIATIDHEMTDLVNELEDATDEEREEIYNRLESLEEARSDLNDYQRELRGIAHDEWEDLRGEIDRAIEEVENKLQELMARL